VVYKHSEKFSMPGGPKSDTSFNYINITPDKLQNTVYNLYCLNNFNVWY